MTASAAFHPQREFVLSALDREFALWDPETDPPVDLICSDPDSGVRWVVQAVGLLEDTDIEPADQLHLALGRLVAAIDAPDSIYALAVPDGQPFDRLRAAVSAEATQRVQLHWLIVDETGEVSAERPPA